MRFSRICTCRDVGKLRSWIRLNALIIFSNPVSAINVSLKFIMRNYGHCPRRLTTGQSKGTINTRALGEWVGSERCMHRLRWIVTNLSSVRIYFMKLNEDYIFSSGRWSRPHRISADKIPQFTRKRVLVRRSRKLTLICCVFTHSTTPFFFCFNASIILN